MWSELREWVVPLLALGSLVWQGVSQLRKNVVRPEDLSRFATTDNLLGLNTALQGQIDTNVQQTTSAHHRIDLLAKDVAALPTHSTVQELRDDVGELKEGQARTGAKLEGIGREIGLVREAVGRVDDFLRATK